MGFRLKTAPVTEPVSRTEAKLHLKVDDTADDTLIDVLIQAAREQVENHCNICLMPQTWELKLSAFPSEGSIELKYPVIGISGVTYQDTNDDTQTFPASGYVLDNAAIPSVLSLAYGQSWPAALDEAGSVTIEFAAGYAEASAVPAAIRSAMLLAIGHLYEHREDVVVGRIVSKMDMASQYLLDPYRIAP